ncbi:MAG TPA: hypothetical protein VF411_11015, partial [Bacteroidia bacterium]
MKKTLLIGSALVIGFAGYSQSNTKKATNPKYTKASLESRKKVTTESPSSSHSNINWRTTVLPNSPSSACAAGIRISSSWNPNGVGGGADCVQQNCLAYNKDLNALIWTQRGSKTWSLFLTSGGEGGTIINHPAPSPHFGYPTNVLDSVVIFSDAASNLVGGRYPGGSWLNPASNTSYTNAYACATGPYNAGTTWFGSVYNAKPLWSKSALTHTQPTFDSLYCVSPAAPMGPMGGSAVYIGAPNVDMQQVGNAVWSTGYYVDNGIAASTTNGYNQIRKGFILKGTIASPGVVNWSVDSTSLNPVFHMGTAPVGRLVAGAPR